MGLKGYRLWVMGQRDSTSEPHHVLPSAPLMTGCGMRAAVWMVRSKELVHSRAATDGPASSSAPRSSQPPWR
jgi:hypothetical protein